MFAEHENMTNVSSAQTRAYPSKKGSGGPPRGGSAQSRTKSKNRAETPCATQKCINTNIHLIQLQGGQKGGSRGSNSGNSFPYGADHPSISVPIRLLLKDGPSGAEPPGPELGDPLRGGVSRGLRAPGRAQVQVPCHPSKSRVSQFLWYTS